MTDTADIRERIAALEVSEVYRKGDLARVHTGLSALNTSFDEFRRQSAPQPIPWLKVIPVTLGLVVALGGGVAKLLAMQFADRDTVTLTESRSRENSEAIKGLTRTADYLVRGFQALGTNLQQVAVRSRVPAEEIAPMPVPPEDEEHVRR